MGIRRALRLPEHTAPPVAGNGTPPAVASPWASGQLSSIVWADLLGAEYQRIDRPTAMAIPAVARARHLVVSTLARLPLYVYTGTTADPITPQPAWPARTDGVVPAQHRMAWTVDDLLFYGWSLWSVTRSSDDGLPLTADRVPAEVWQFDAIGRVVVRGQIMDAEQVVLIPGLHEGLVEFGGQTLHAADRLARSALVAAENPVPMVELHQTAGEALTDDEIDKATAQWRKARTQHGVGYTSPNVEAKPHGAPTENLLIEGRNAAAVDIARAIGVPAAMIDATTAGASLTYETVEGRNREFVDYGLSLYMTPISARLSLDDVTARGQTVRFDLESYTGPTPTAAGDDAAPDPSPPAAGPTPRQDNP